MWEFFLIGFKELKNKYINSWIVFETNLKNVLGACNFTCFKYNEFLCKNKFKIREL